MTVVKCPTKICEGYGYDSCTSQINQLALDTDNVSQPMNIYFAMKLSGLGLTSINPNLINVLERHLNWGKKI